MKLRKISDIRPTLGFTEYDFLEKYRESFKLSELGRIHEQLPLSELAAKLYSHSTRKHPQGNKPLFPPEGEIALMFLKPYLGLSDEGLVQALNGSIHMQMFCGVLIDPANPVKDGKIVSAIRNRLARLIDIKELQQVLYDWIQRSMLGQGNGGLGRPSEWLKCRIFGRNLFQIAQKNGACWVKGHLRRSMLGQRLEAAARSLRDGACWVNRPSQTAENQPHDGASWVTFLLLCM